MASELIESFPLFESGLLLPDGEAVADLPEQKATAQAADEERTLRVEAFALADLPLVEPAQLPVQRLAEQDLPRAVRLAGALEDREQQVSSWPVIAAHIPDRERDEFVFAQACTEGHRVQHVIAAARSVLAGDLEQGSLLAFALGPWGACRFGLVRHRWA